MPSPDERRSMMEAAVKRGKYAPLYKYLKSRPYIEWSPTFSEIEKILGFALPESARLRRPWWANTGMKGGHSQAMAWELAGWKTSQVDMEGEKLVFVRETQT